MVLNIMWSIFRSDGLVLGHGKISLIQEYLYIRMLAENLD
jgi:hypothetical protein